MANRIQHLRGSESEHNNFTGAKGEISLVTDTTSNKIPTGELRVHDGSTAGGLPIELSNGTTLKQSSIVTTNGAASYNITIPAGVKYITAMVIDVTATGNNSSGQASDFVFRLGTSTGVKTSGYNSSGGYVGASSGIEGDTTGFKIYNNTTSNTIQNFIADFYLFDSTRWVMKGQGNYVTAATQYFTQSAGSVTLDGSVTTISLVSVSSTSQTFDGGEFRVMYA